MHRTSAFRLFRLLAIVTLGLAACSSTVGYVSRYVSGTITFPNEAVRAVFERLETNPSVLDNLPPAPEPKAAPRDGGTSGHGPQAPNGCTSPPTWWPVGVACAQEVQRARLPEDPEWALLKELAGTTEVKEAVRSRQPRRPLIKKWKNAGLIGEGRNGLVIFLMDRREVDREILARVANENDDRLIIMRGMAKAVVAIHGIEPSEKQVLAQMPAAQRESATVRRRLSARGTWVELPDGQWVKK